MSPRSRLTAVITLYGGFTIGRPWTFRGPPPPPPAGRGPPSWLAGGARTSGGQSIRAWGSLRKLRAYAGGLVGNGCIGEVFSPGTSDCGTGRSSIGHTGRPVTRSNTYRNACLPGRATALIGLPS